MTTPAPSASPLIELLAAMESAKASDLFLSEGRVPAARINGRVRPLNRAPVSRAELMSLLEGAMSPGAMERFRATGDSDCSLALPDGRRFRINAFREQSRMGVVARAVPSGAVSLDDLGLPDAARVMAENHRGLVLVTGATGSGKSTSLAAMIHYINETRDVHIITVEDPIEYVHRDRRARVTQREVGIDTPDFKAALKYILRQSPDVILIGELRDEETVHVAMQAALTGHLVFATLHTNDAASAVARLVEMGAEPYLVASALRCVVSQRLVRNICQRCKEDFEAPPELMEKLRGPVELPPPPLRLWRGKGCRYCFNTGYRGRTVISELLPVDEAVRAKIVARAPSEAIAKAAEAQGMRPMYWDGVDKVLKGISTLEEVLEAAEDLDP